jgi:peroxiredoxin
VTAITRADRRRLLQAALALPVLPVLVACGRRDAAPDVTYTLLDGSKGATAALRGKVLLVNFWATSCSTCVKEMPQIVATHRKYQARGFDTLAVAMSYDPPAHVANYAETRRLPFGVVIDNTGSFARAYGDVQATPTTFLIDKQGRIARQYVGQPDFAALHGLVEQLLAEA